MIPCTHCFPDSSGIPSSGLSMAVRVLEATKDVFELIFAEPQKAFFPKVFDDQAVFAKQRVYVNLPNLLVQVFG